MTAHFLWNQEFEDRLTGLYLTPGTTDQNIADGLGITISQVRKKVAKLRLSKPPMPSDLRFSHSKDGVSCFVSVTGGHQVWVDDADANILIARKWYVHRGDGGGLYVYSTSPRPVKKLHRIILDLPPGTPLVDHRDRNGLNNRRNNLRLATHRQNCQNTGKRRNTRSEYKGVWRHVSGLFGGAVTDASGKRRSIGYYKSEYEAARAHDALVTILWGDFAYLNLPNDRMTDREVLAVPALARASQHCQISYLGFKAEVVTAPGAL